MKKSIAIFLLFLSVTLSLSKAVNSQTYNGGIQVGQGEYVTFFIDNNGTLTAIGNRGYTGVGGNGSSGSAGASGIPEPVIVSPSNLKFKHAAGHFHGGAAVDVNGSVWTMGTTVAGESGMGNTNYSQYPQKILTDISGNTFDSVVAVIAYAQSSDEQAEQHGWLALKSTGTLWIWGTPGAMRGNGTEDLNGRVLRPTRIIIPGGRSVKQVAGGDYITALCTDGTVWTWGNTYRANLGYIYSGMEYASPHQINVSGITQIAGGKQFNYALKSTGELYGWGLLGNYMNDLTYPEGTGPEITFPQLLPNIQGYLSAPISKILTSFSISLALLTDGSLWTWGDNTQGCIGNGESYYGNPTNGYAWDYSIHLLRKIPYHVAPTRTFKNVFAGNTLCFYTYALGTDDQVYAWGTNRGSVIANRINMPVTGNLNFYDNSWNRPWPQPVNPFNITTDFISTSPICLNDPSTYPCNTYSIPANTKPIANAGPNQSVAVTSATLDGRGSTDNVFISYYLWSQVSGPNTAVMDLPASPTPRVSSMVTGTYVFKLKTIDNGWFSDSATVQVIVNAGGNESPTANAGANQTIVLPASTVTLSGSGTDADGTIASYAWTQVGGAAATIANPALASTGITGLTTAGARVFRLTVTDNQGATGTSDVTITVNTAPVNGKNIPGRIEAENYDNKSGPLYAVTTTDAGGGQQVIGINNGSWMDYNVTVTQSGTYTVNFRVATAQNNAQFQIKLGATILATLNIPNTGGWNNWLTVAVSNVPLTAGTQTLRIFSTNTETANFNWMDWAITTQNTSPVANAGSPQTIVLPINQAVLTGSGIANNGGSITGYAWTQVGGTAATIANPSSASTNITGLTTTGIRTFRLTVTQNDNQTATNDVTVTVNATQPNPPPTANAGSAQTITLPATQATLTGSGTANNGGTIISYAWTQVGGTAATITSPSSASTTITGLTTTGVRTFRLTVTQNDNQTATSDVTVTVNPAVGNGKTIPGKIEAESYDNKSGPLYAVTTNDAGGGQHVIGISNGSWMDYNVTVTQAGAFTVTFRVATAQNNAQFQIKSGAAILGTINIPNTGGWDTWQTITVSNISLSAGAQTIRIQSNNNESCNFNWMNWALAIVSTAPTANAGSPQTITLPVTQVSLSGSGAANNGGSIISHTWSKFSGGSATITDVSNYNTTVTGLSAGTYIFRLTVTQNDNQTTTNDVTVTVNPAAGNGKTIAGKIEAENYDNKSGPLYAVTTNDAGGGQQVIGISNGSWIDYNVNVTQSGTYMVNFRVATAQNNAQFQIKLGAAILGTINIPNTGGWDSWQTVAVNNITLTAGVQTIRIQSTNNESCNFNWMDWALIAPATAPVTTAINSIGSGMLMQNEKIVNNLLVSVFPNPVSSYFNLRVQSKSMEIVIIKVVDLSGRLVQQLQIIPGQAIKFGDTMKSGTYFIEAKQGSEKVVTKVVKQ